MPILIAFVLALATVPLGRGRLGRLADIRLRRWWLLAVAFALQLGALQLPEGPAGGALHVSSYLAGAVYLLSNLHLPGLWWVGLGGSLNFVAIAANGGVMPAEPGALAVVGGEPTERFSNSAALEDPRLAFLGDIFPLPLPAGLSNVVSLGDLVICVGLFLAVHRITGSTLVRPASGLARDLASRPRVRTIALAHSLGWAGSWLVAAAVVMVTVGRPGALAAAVAMGLSGFCAALMLGGPLVDRFNRPALLACVTFGQACASALLLIWPSLSLVGATAVVVGFGAGLAQPAVLALVSEVVEPRHRTAVLGGLTAVTATVGLLGAGFPVALVRSGGPRPVLAAATLACGLAALAWSITPAQRRQPPGRSTLWRDLLGAMRALEDTPALARLALLAAGLGGGVGLAASDPFVALGLAWRRATPLGLSAGSMAVGVLVGALSCAAVRRPGAVLGPAFALAGGGLFVGAAGSEAPWALAGWFAGGCGVGAAGVLLASATLGLSATHLGGRLLALILAGQLVGLGTGYTLGGSLSRSGGPVASGAGAGIVLFAAAVMAARFKGEPVLEEGVDDSPQEPAEGMAAEVLEEGEQVGGDHGRAPGDVHQETVWAESVELLSADDVLRLGGERQGHEADPATEESLGEISEGHGPCRTCQWLGISAHDCCLHLEESELGEQGPDRATLSSIRSASDRESEAVRATGRG